MHPPSSLFLLSLLHLSTSSVIRRQDPALQYHPDVASAPGSFSNGKPWVGQPAEVGDPIPAIYGPRSVDLPFNRLYHGHMKFFSAGQLNTPDGNTDIWDSANDNANQSACGIPDNAFRASKVAIHPYFLKYAGLDRYCMQDVCISFWKADGTSDMMLKVTDICSTDPSDPTHCTNPSDIKIDRNKAQQMEGLGHPPQGDQYPEEAWWFFTKCWADGLPQEAYQGPNNWFAHPPLPNNQKHAAAAATQQYKNNQAAYAAKGWPTYPDGSYTLERTTKVSPPISDWVPGQEPAWSPIAGGRGWAGKSSSNPSSPSNSSPPNPPVNPAAPPPSSNPPSSSSSPSTTTSSFTSSAASGSTGTPGPNNGYAASSSSSVSASTSSSASAPADAQQTDSCPGTTGSDNGYAASNSSSASASTSSGASASTSSSTSASTSSSASAPADAQKTGSSTTPSPDYGYAASTSSSSSSSASAPASTSATAPADAQQTGSSTAPPGKQAPPSPTDPEIIDECEA